MKNSIETTETVQSKDKWIDKIDQIKALTLMLEDQSKAIEIIRENLEVINKIINKVYMHLNSTSSGRLIYVGAGTSGRIAVQDAIELYPTFSWPKSRIAFVVAGGIKALYNTVENAEDDLNDAVFQSNNIDINDKDVVIGLSASSNTPFTLEVLKLANEKNALTVGIGNNFGIIRDVAKESIIIPTGSEIVAGSTRLKAGTAQKITLNIISTMIMVKFGRVKNGMMVAMVASNKKLKKRQILIDELLN